MKPWCLLPLLVCAGCGGKGLSKDIEKVNDLQLDLGAKTEAVCAVADQMNDFDAEQAISEHAFKILKQPQKDKVALKAQLDCMAKGMKKHSKYPMGVQDNIVRAYAKNPSDVMKEAFKMIGEDERRQQLGAYIEHLALWPEDVPDAVEVTPGLVSAMDELRVTEWVSGGMAVLYWRTGHPALKARFDKADPVRVEQAWASSVDLIERGPKEDRKKLVEKLVAEVAARKSQFDIAYHCKLALDVAGCDQPLKAQAEAQAKNEAQTSPILAVLEPVQRAAAAKSDSNTTSTFLAEQDGTAPSPAAAPEVPEVPEMAIAIDKLVALGKPIEQDCRTFMRFGGPGGLTCARALGKMKLQLLTEATLAALAEYNELYAKNGRKAHKDGHGVVTGLRALMTHKEKAADEVFLQALSAYDPVLAQDVMAKVKERSKMEDVVDGLFQFMARKESFAVTEIDNYVGLLTQYGAAVTAPIVKNLERELAKAKKPEKVFWAHKVVALFALEKSGTAAAVPILDKYAADTSGYQNVKTAGESGPVKSSENVPFAQTVSAAKRAVATR